MVFDRGNTLVTSKCENLVADNQEYITDQAIH